MSDLLNGGGRLLLRRRMMMSLVHESPWPEDLQRVEWISPYENASSPEGYAAYINTGIANGGKIIEFDYAFSVIPRNDTAIAGAWGDLFLYVYDSKLYYAFGDGERSIVPPGGFDLASHNYIIDSKGEFIYDGNVISYSPHTPHQDDMPIGIFQRVRWRSDSQTNGRMRTFVIKDASTGAILFNGFPARALSARKNAWGEMVAADTAGMYDTVSRKFYTSDREGYVFYAGPDYNGYIYFADPVVEQICATNWGDGIGITPSQAAAVTSLGDVFRGNTSIVSFDELQYFTGLTGLGFSCFSECTSLQTITIPALAASNFARLVFNNCTSLERIYLKGPCGPSQWVDFIGCAALRRVEFDRLSDWLDCQFGNERGFFAASGYGSVYIGGVEATSVVIPDGYTSIGRSVFWGCRNLLSVSIPNSVTSIGTFAFYDTGLTSIQFPSSLTTIDDFAFALVHFTSSVILPPSVTTLGHLAVASSTMPAFVSLPTSPPVSPLSYANIFRSTDFPIYVPYSADHSILDAYKAANGWSQAADRIFELNPDGTIPS